MSSQIPWYYMWSQKYEFFHRILQDNMKEPNLKLEPIFIDQSAFDSSLYQREGHPWLGSTLKVDTIIRVLKESKDTYILFTDIDIIVKPGIYDRLKIYMGSDISMVFLKEGEHLNIGYMLLKVCPDVLAFWELVRAKVIDDPSVLDQRYVLDLAAEFPGRYTTFDNQEFACTNTWLGKTPFLVMQILSSCLGKEYDFPEKIFHTAQNMDVQAYMKYVPEYVVPFIYKYQELLMRSHKEAKTAFRS